MRKKLIVHRGVKMTEDWPAKIAESQRANYYTCKDQQFPRIRFGDDNPNWGERPCRDCGVVKGEYHVLGCEYETCPVCGKSFAEGCACEIIEIAKRQAAEKPVARTESRGFRFFIYAIFTIVGLFLLRAILMLFGI